MKFFVPGKPFGKPRHRMRIAYKGQKPFCMAYPDTKGQLYESRVVIALRQQQPGFEPFPKDTPLYLRIVAVFEPPASWSGSKKKDALDSHIHPAKKPDWDNIGKIICDALNGIAFHDDAQIIHAEVLKSYGIQEGVEVEIVVFQ